MWQLHSARDLYELLFIFQSVAQDQVTHQEYRNVLSGVRPGGLPVCNVLYYVLVLKEFN